MISAATLWLVWRGMLQVSPNAARVWALAATALLPLAAWSGWWFGHTEARGRLAGIDQAVDKVIGAATRVAAPKTKQRAATEPPTVVLPDVEIFPRQLSSGGNDVIEL
jgi:hypothetical protein